MTETLRNEILILIDTLKESDLYADFKHISSIKFSPAHQKPEKIYPFSKKGKTPPKSYKILFKFTSSDSAYQKTLLLRFQAPICKNVEF